MAKKTVKNKALLDRLQKPGPKRILALDGGGIRGALTLGFLEEIETLLRKRHGNDPDFRLCDYFDLIGGTSTGSIIAAALSIGKSAREIKDLYLDIGAKIFGKKYWIGKAFFKGAFYDHLPLENALEKEFKNITLDSEEIKTGLCIITKRADTYSVWALYNHPANKFLHYNGHLKLWQLCRASSAAPTYFEPKILNINPLDKKPQFASFIDGGVSSFNNPALQLFMLAAIKGFSFNWETSEDKLLITSVGTGTHNYKYDYNQYRKKNMYGWAKEIPGLLMEDTGYLNQAMLQFISNSPTAVDLDSHIGKMDTDLLGGKSILTYLRYNALLEKKSLDQLGLSFPYDQKEIESMREMDRSKHRFQLAEIGEKEAAKQIEEAHFPKCFDVK